MVGFDGLIPALKNRLIENLKNHIGQVSKPWFFARTKALGSASPMKNFYKQASCRECHVIVKNNYSPNGLSS